MLVGLCERDYFPLLFRSFVFRSLDGRWARSWGGGEDMLASLSGCADEGRRLGVVRVHDDWL